MKDSQFESQEFTLSEKKHFYGPQVHLLEDPFLQSELAKLSSVKTMQPDISRLVKKLYVELVRLAVRKWVPTAPAETETRMSSFHPKEATYTCPVLSRNEKVTTVSLARAGIAPSEICYEECNELLEPSLVRQDHILASRVLDQNGKVTGTSFASSKIGGCIKDQLVFFPDPMGATGGTIEETIKFYRSISEGEPKKWIALHLIITPEYLKKVIPLSPNMEVLAIRLDRGLSSDKVLSQPLGKQWDQEKGLNDNQYIVPGAGGLGEILNNVYV